MKKTINLILFLLLIIFSSTILAQIQGGTFFVDNSTKNFTLNANEGKREVAVEINFSKSFTEKPTVLIALSLIDLQGEKFEVQANLKVNQTLESRGLKIAADATGISRDGFVLKIVVWGNTKINAAGGSWFAFTQ
jgi:hypothetical protein